MTTTELRISGMDCADCAKTLEKGVGGLDGVQACRVNFMSGSMQIEGEASLESIAQRVQALGYGIRQSNAPADEAATITREGVLGFFEYLLARRDTALVLAGLVALVASLAGSLLGGPALLVGGLQLVIIAAVGLPIMRLGLRQFLFSRDVTINLLMSLAVVGAVFIGEWGEAATVIVLFAIGEALEGYAADRARGALQSLMLLAPQEALVLGACMDCEAHMGQDGYTGGPCPFCGTHEQMLPVQEVNIGDTVIVRAGERVALDGAVISGRSAVNQAPITGESLPIEKSAGDTLYAGSVNGSGVLQMRVTDRAEDSTLSRIIRLVEAASAQKAPTERFVDRFARWYTPAVVVLAIAIAIVPPLVAAASFDDWLYRALTLLVVACPCALVISTPVSVVSAMTRAARMGVLIKGGAYLEALGAVKAIAFDKTGTITTGEPRVVAVNSVACVLHQDPCPACEEVLALADAVERQSEHPLGAAVVSAARERGVSGRYTAREVQTLAGRGISGEIAAADVIVASHRYFDERYPHSEGLCQAAQAQEAYGHTVMMVAQSDTVRGFISVADTPRAVAKNALAQLRGIETIMLTGDNHAAARTIADEVGIDTVYAELMPQQKVAQVQALREKHGAVAMVGDGVNDAPALAMATVGIAMGGAGSAQAMETADVVLMQDDLAQLPAAIRLSRRARRIIQQNIGVSLVIKAIFVVLTVLGFTTLWMAVFADVGMSLLVTLNGMRLLASGPQNLAENGAQ